MKEAAAAVLAESLRAERADAFNGIPVAHLKHHRALHPPGRGCRTVELEASAPSNTTKIMSARTSSDAMVQIWQAMLLREASAQFRSISELTNRLTAPPPDTNKTFNKDTANSLLAPQITKLLSDWNKNPETPPDFLTLIRKVVNPAQFADLKTDTHQSSTPTLLKKIATYNHLLAMQPGLQRITRLRNLTGPQLYSAIESIAPILTQYRTGSREWTEPNVTEDESKIQNLFSTAKANVEPKVK